MYSIIIQPNAEEDIEYYRVNEQRKIIDGIKTQLRDQPDAENRRKKKLRPNTIAPWELRVDIYRVFYKIADDSVLVVAVGHKVHNKLYIRGVEVEL